MGTENQDAHDGADDNSEENTSLLGGNPSDNVDNENNEENNEPEYQLDDDGNQVLDDDGNPIEVEAEGYTDFELPEGMEVDEEFLGTSTEAFKEIGLSQEQSQKVVDLYSGQLKAQGENWQEQLTTWQSESRNDSEYGGEAFNANIGLAGNAIDQFASPEFAELLETTGLGNHPEVIRTFVNIGKQLAEDSPNSGGKPPNEELSTEEILYGQT